MKKLIFGLICFFACAQMQARITLHQSDFDEKTPIEAFSENPSESHPDQILYLVETASGQHLFLVEKCASGKYRARYFSTDMGRFVSRDPLGYVDGFGLYNGYFAERLLLDPSGYGLSKATACTSCADHEPNTQQQLNAFWVVSHPGAAAGSISCWRKDGVLYIMRTFCWEECTGA